MIHVYFGLEENLSVPLKVDHLSCQNKYRSNKLTYCKVESSARKFPFPLDHLLTSASKVSANLCK